MQIIVPDTGNESMVPLINKGTFVEAFITLSTRC